MLDVMYDANARCPEITRIYNLSEPSVRNRSLTVIEFSDNPGTHEIGKRLEIGFPKCSVLNAWNTMYYHWSYVSTVASMVGGSNMSFLQ